MKVGTSSKGYSILIGLTSLAGQTNETRQACEPHDLLDLFHLLCYNPQIMKRIWSPWRMKYIEGHEGEEGCIFCNALAQPDDEENLIIKRGTLAFVILNLYPYTSGHIMVAPMAHQPSLEFLDPDSRAEMMELISECLVVLQKVYRPQAFNIGANIGEAAGAGEPGHVHMHIVPRWEGDTNFMSTLGETRVLPEALEKTYKRIKAGFER